MLLLLSGSEHGVRLGWRAASWLFADCGLAELAEVAVEGDEDEPAEQEPDGTLLAW